MQAKLNRFSSHSNMPEMQGFSLIRESHSSSRMMMMFGKSLEKRLIEISRRIKKEKEDLLVAEEQLISLIKIRNEIDRLEEIQDGLLDKLNVENI